MSSLQHIRVEIDAIDQQIYDLVVQRVSLSAKAQKSMASGILSPLWEKETLVRMKERNQNRLVVEPLLSIMRSVISLCRGKERLQVLFLGPRGTFSEVAATRYFGSDITLCPKDSLVDVFTMLGTGKYAVVPISNSIAGEIEETAKYIADERLEVVDSIDVPVEQCLLSTTYDLDAFTHVYSHRVSLVQCKGWLDRHLPNVVRVAASSNADAMRMALDNPASAAIGSCLGAEFYPLHILQRNIQDNPENTTTFHVVTAKV